MYCTHCGQQIPDNSKFCRFCGGQVAKPQQAAEPQPQPQPQQQQQYQSQQQYQQPYGQTQQQYQQPYGQPQYQQQPYGQPVRQLKTNRNLAVFILLNIVTLGIYSIVTFSSISESINIAASRHDGRKTMHFCLLFFLVGPITLGIGYIVWYHKISERIGQECLRRGINYQFGASDYWIFNILLSIVIVGPFIYLHKLFNAINFVCADYNARG